MRTSLNELRLAEEYLLQTAPPGEQLVFEARLIVQPSLREETGWQQKTYRIIREYGRQQLLAEIGETHQKLFSDDRYAGFRRRISRIFRTG